jgi:DNA-binding transcriptional ArsR family regulator
MENETKNTATVIEAVKATTVTKPAAKKATKTVKSVERKTNLFSLAAKVKVDDLGAGQRAAIAKILKKTGGATRAQLIAALPDVPPANISWHLSMMVGDKTAKKVAQS